MIHRLPSSAKRFSKSVNNTRGSVAVGQIQSRAERSAAASTVRDLVRLEAKLTRSARQPEELARVRTRINAYCHDYEGLSDLVSTLRSSYSIPETTPATAPSI